VPLALNHTYEVSFYVCVTESSPFALDNLGAFLSVGPIADPGGGLHIPFTPQVRNPAGNFLSSLHTWVLIHGTYTAAGFESHLTIGNFYDNANSPLVPLSGHDHYPYYYVDDVSVVDTCVPYPTNKTVISGSAWSFDVPPVVDDCSGTNVTLTFTTVTNSIPCSVPPCPQAITRTWVATDPCGNSSSFSQTVTVYPHPVLGWYVSGNNLILDWFPPQYRLQFATNLSGPWVNHDLTNPPVVVPMTNVAQWFRLLKTD
jgi:hypothetical protein